MIKILICFALLISYSVAIALDGTLYFSGNSNNSYILHHISSKNEEDSKFYIKYTNDKSEIKCDSSKVFQTDCQPPVFVHKYYFSTNIINKSLNSTFIIVNNQFTKELNLPKFKSNSENIEFTVMGDNRSGIKIWNKISTLMNSEKSDFTLLLGDLAYKPDCEFWKDEFFTSNAVELLQKVPWHNSPGNHEKWKLNTWAFTGHGICDDCRDGFYNFDYGDATFLILNTETAVGTNSKQWKYAENVLKNSKKKWKIVAFHIPAYSAGAHNENAAMKLMTSQIFEKFGVDLVLTGHSHFYQHNLVSGIHHIVTGGGGSPLYSPKPKDYSIKSLKEYHYLKIHLNSNTIEVKAINEKGKEIDQFQISK